VDEEQLVSALRMQDPDGMGRLVDAVGNRLLRSACLLCGNASEALDMVQETFLQALKSAHRFRGESGVYSWLHGILLNLTRHYHRERGRILYNDPGVVGPEPAALEDGAPMEADFDTASTGLEQALRRLPQTLREILVLRFYEEMKLDEIAAHLGIPRGTVKSRLHYALKEMRKLVPNELNLFGTRGTEITKRK